VNAALGTAGIVLGVAASIGGVVTLAVALLGGRRNLIPVGRSYVMLALLGAVLAFVAMERALITRDFTVQYVADNGSHDTPALYNFATLWAALEGSILLWALVLTGYMALVVHKFRKRLDDPLVGWAMLTMLVVSGFFFLLLLMPANPFTAFDPPAGFDGPGPNPLLQNHPLMAFHPPALYLGYVGFTVPFAFAVAALVTGRVGEGWLLETRRWTLFAWGFLTFGIVLGAWWSYEVLNWGGYWGWDPVENASLLPWLTGTAFIHSVMVQERRGMLRVWNLSLVCATFSLTILGTFLTRSGVIASVHAFTEGSIGAWLLGFFGLTVAVTLGLIGWRADRLRAPGSVDSPVSREGAFLANNVLFAGFAFVVLLGTVFPLIVEAANDDQLSVGSPYFDSMTIPIGLTLLFLMAIAPVLPWRKASTELLSQRLFWPAWAGTAAIVVALLPSAWAGSPPAPRCARWCSPPGARDGAAWWAAPTAAWSCTSGSCSSPWPWPRPAATTPNASSRWRSATPRRSPVTRSSTWARAPSRSRTRPRREPGSPSTARCTSPPSTSSRRPSSRSARLRSTPRSPRTST
jgi:cytochrome c-type biogenesis protein CcmF